MTCFVAALSRLSSSFSHILKPLLCLQDLFQVLFKEDAGAVRGRSHELLAAVYGGGQAGRCGGCSQQSL